MKSFSKSINLDETWFPSSQATIPHPRFPKTTQIIIQRSVFIQWNVQNNGKKVFCAIVNISFRVVAFFCIIDSVQSTASNYIALCEDGTTRVVQNKHEFFFNFLFHPATCNWSFSLALKAFFVCHSRLKAFMQHSMENCFEPSVDLHFSFSLSNLFGTCEFSVKTEALWKCKNESVAVGKARGITTTNYYLFDKVSYKVTQSSPPHFPNICNSNYCQHSPLNSTFIYLDEFLCCCCCCCRHDSLGRKFYDF